MEEVKAKKSNIISLFIDELTIGAVIIISALFWVLPANSAQAATLYLSPSEGSYTVGQNFNVSVFVSSSDQTINAISGRVSFSSGQLEVTSLSKSGSIISLWVQEPSFSNSTAEVKFEGIILNPGFTGKAGKVITISFKVKTVGSAQVKFASGSILANDGKGTNVLTGMGSASFNINPQAVGAQPSESTSPVDTAGVPLAPRVTSSTHPDPNSWYTNNNPKFEWILLAGVTGVNVLADHSPNTNPGTRSDGLRNSYTYSDVDDGIWYFHIRLQNKFGWGAVSHFRFQIDTVPPNPFVIKFVESKTNSNSRPLITFDTTDTLSGIDHYKITVDKDKTKLSIAEMESNPYQLALQLPGSHTILVQAYDKAGNYTSAVDEFTVIPLKTPVFTDYPKTLRSGEILIVKGKTDYPEAQVTIWLQHEKEEPLTKKVASDKDGKFIFTAPEKLAEGVYKLWAMVTDKQGAQSDISEVITIPVQLPVTLKIGKLAFDYLNMLITLIVLLIGIIATIVYSWYRVSYWRKKITKISKVTIKTEKNIHKAFDSLKNEVEKQVAKLDGEPGLSKKEQQIANRLKQALQSSEKYLEEELVDIEKETEK